MPSRKTAGGHERARTPCLGRVRNARCCRLDEIIPKALSRRLYSMTRGRDEKEHAGSSKLIDV
jgi:hypothetical protein